MEEQYGYIADIYTKYQIIKKIYYKGCETNSLQILIVKYTNYLKNFEFTDFIPIFA